MKKAIIIAPLFLFTTVAYTQNNPNENFQWALKEGWKMQTSLTTRARGEEVSKQNFSTHGWYNVRVPTTIVAGLLANNVYNFDPFFAKNLQKISGRQFDHSWWFWRFHRKDTFCIPDQYAYQ